MCLSIARFGPVSKPTPAIGTKPSRSGTWNGYAAVEVQFRKLPVRERVDVDWLLVPWSRAGAGVTRKTKQMCDDM